MARTLKEYPRVALQVEDIDGKIDFVGIFGRPGPVHIEIGSGKATFLVSQAQAQGEVNFLGIERARKYYRYSVDRIGRRDIKNVRIIRTDAAAFLADHVPDDSIECFHLYFPDPWPKKRHHKRRFLCPANIEHLLRCLKSCGRIRIATDHAEYFDVIKTLITDHANVLEEIDFLSTAGAEAGEITGTNFERKYIKDKRNIFTLAVKKLYP